MLASFFRTIGRLYEDTLFRRKSSVLLGPVPRIRWKVLYRERIECRFAFQGQSSKALSFGMSHFIIHAQIGLSSRIYPLRSGQKRR